MDWRVEVGISEVRSGVEWRGDVMRGAVMGGEVR